MLQRALTVSGGGGSGYTIGENTNKLTWYKTQTISIPTASKARGWCGSITYISDTSTQAPIYIDENGDLYNNGVKDSAYSFTFNSNSIVSNTLWSQSKDYYLTGYVLY